MNRFIAAIILLATFCLQGLGQTGNIITVNTAADMVASTVYSYATNRTVVVRSGGAAGVYNFALGDTTATNTTGVFASTGVAGRWLKMDLSGGAADLSAKLNATNGTAVNLTGSITNATYDGALIRDVKVAFVENLQTLLSDASPSVAKLAFVLNDDSSGDATKGTYRYDPELAGAETSTVFQCQDQGGNPATPGRWVRMAAGDNYQMSVDTLDDALAVTPSYLAGSLNPTNSVKLTVKTRARSALGAKGAATYYYSATAPGATNGGTIVAYGSGYLLWDREGQLTPQMFRAKGDGVNDDTDAIQQAINAAANYTAFSDSGTNVQGGTVFFPVGIYRVTSPITVTRAVRLRGEAASMANGPSVGILWGTVIKSEITSGSVFEVTGYGDTGYARSLGFRDLAIQGGGAEDDGINYNTVASGYDFTVENVTIRGCGRTGLRFEANGSLAYSTLRNLRVTSNGQDGIYIAQSYGGGNAVGMTLENCYSASNGRYGFALDGMSQVHLVNCVENNSGSHAYYVKGHVNRFDHCFAEDAAGAGVFMWEARNNLFDQFNVARCVSGGSTNGLITLSTNSYNNVFSRSVLDLPSSPTGPHVLFHASSASWNAFRDTAYSETRTVTDNASQNLFTDDFDSSLAPTAQARNRTLTGGGNVQFSHGISMTNSARITLQNNQPLQAFDSGGTARQLAVMTSGDLWNIGDGARDVRLLGTGFYLGSAGTAGSVFVTRNADATSGSQLQNSRNLSFELATWNGSSSSTSTIGLRATADSTAPTGSLYFNLLGTDRMRLKSDGTLYIGSANTQVATATDLASKLDSTNGTAVNLTGTANSLYQVPFSTFRVFGDSTSNEADEWAEVLADDWGISTENFAVSGYYLIQMMDRAFTNSVATNLTTAIQCCVNDSRETNTTRINTWSNAVPAAIAFHAIPDSRKLWANNANAAYTGTWSTDTKWSGVGKVSTVNGSTVTFTNYGTVVYIATRQTNSGGAGTYTVTIDGVSQGTFDAGGAVYGSSAGASPRLLRFGGLSEALHVTTITVTSSTSAANPVWFDWSAGNLGHNTDYGPRVYFSNTTRRTAASYSSLGGSEATVEQQNETIRYFVNQLAGDGLNVTLMEFGAALDPVNTSDGTHPNSTGTRQMVNAAKATMLGNMQPRYQPIASASASGSGGAAQTPWTSNIDADGYNLTGAGSLEAGVFASSATPAASGTVRLGAADSIVIKGSSADYAVVEISGNNMSLGDQGAVYVQPGSAVQLRPNGVGQLAVSANTIQLGQPSWSSPATQVIKPQDPVGANLTGATLRIFGGQSTGSGDGGEVQIYTERDQNGGASTVGSATRSVRVVKNGLTDLFPWGADTAVGVGGTLSTTTTAVGNSAGSETDLMSYTVPASVTGVSGEAITLECWGIFAGNTNTKRVIVYFGGVSIFDTTALAFNDGNWHLIATVTRTGSATARAVVRWMSSNATLPHYVSTSLSLTPTWSSSQVFKVTGNASGASDISAAVAKWSYLR